MSTNSETTEFHELARAGQVWAPGDRHLGRYTVQAVGEQGSVVISTNGAVVKVTPDGHFVGAEHLRLMRLIEDVPE